MQSGQLMLLPIDAIHAHLIHVLFCIIYLFLVIGCHAEYLRDDP